MITQKITPYLWVEKDAKVVADYYLSIFKDGKLKDCRKFDSDESGNNAGIETALIEITGMEFSILAAGPLFKFNEAVSFVINTKDQAETDYYWEALTKNGGEEGSCGWCKDKYGLSWQVVPTEYFELIHSDDPIVREKAMKNTDRKNNFKDKSEIHNSMLQFFYKSENGENEITSSYHSHALSEYISSTDICTLLLYREFVEWKQHLVISEKEVSIFNLEQETLVTMKRIVGIK